MSDAFLGTARPASVDNFLRALRTYPGKRVSLPEAKKAFLATRPTIRGEVGQLYLLQDYLKELEGRGDVTLPSKAGDGWERAGSPPLPLWVLVTPVPAAELAEDYTAVTWVPEMGFWTELKTSQLPAAKAINDFLLRRPPASLMLVPIKERSLEIFGDEKRLDALRTGDTLFKGRLPLATLGAYVVPTPLPYRATNAPGRPVLVVENHCSFWSLGEWNQRAKRYAAIAYGAGGSFQSSGDALAQVLRETGGSIALYLGDLDPAGLRIPSDFNSKRSPAQTEVRPALNGYRWLLANGRRREMEEPNEMPPSAAAWLGEALSGEVAAMWEASQWIPQEALGLEQLLAGALD